MNKQYLIPANTKRGQLIFGLFRPIDLTIFGTGIVSTFLALIILQNYLTNTNIALACLAPVMITGLLVAPVPYYHNVMTLIFELYDFITTRQKFVWKGWCFSDGENTKK